MNSHALNLVGLVLNIIGVVILFFYAFPKPTNEETPTMAWEKNTPLGNGKTAAEHEEVIRGKKNRGRCNSMIGLGLVLFGFVFQLLASLK